MVRWWACHGRLAARLPATPCRLHLKASHVRNLNLLPHRVPAGPGGTDRLLRDVALVLTHRQLAPAAAAAAAEPSSSSPSSPDGCTASAQLALLAARAARASVAVAASRGWPALAGLMLPHVMSDGR